jgi:hypothetical protein
MSGTHDANPPWRCFQHLKMCGCRSMFDGSSIGFLRYEVDRHEVGIVLAGKNIACNPHVGSKLVHFIEATIHHVPYKTKDLGDPLRRSRRFPFRYVDASNLHIFAF